MVAYENQVVMGETLDAGLAELFGGAPAAGPGRQPAPVAEEEAPPGDSGLSALTAEAQRRYQAALEAQRNLDWAKYGEEMKRLGEVIERLGKGGARR